MNVAEQDIDYRHPAHKEFAHEWRLVSDCVAGERAVKKPDVRMQYLPHPASDWENSDPELKRYTGYITRAPFLNATGRTLQGLLGIAFAKPVKVELSGKLAELEYDVDGQGQPLTQLMRDGVSQNLQKGRGGILTDYTGTGEQSIAAAGRPLLKLYKAGQIINWRVTNGRTSLVVLKEEQAVDLPNEFRLELRTKWTELRLVGGVPCARIWLKSANGDLSVSELAPIRGISGKPLSDLPWSWIGANNNDHTPDVPPLADIASLNIKHYQAEADIAEIAHLVGCPTLSAAGLDEVWADKYLADGIRIGSTQGVLLPAGGSLGIVQAEDRNLPLTVAERREKQMAMLGAKLVERGTASKTATQANDEAQTDNSILSLCVSNVEAAINRALAFAAEFATGEGSVTINKRYEIAQLDSQAITALLAAVQSGKMLLVDFIRYMQSVGLIDPSADPNEVETALRAQSDLGNTYEHNDDGDD